MTHTEQSKLMETSKEFDAQLQKGMVFKPAKSEELKHLVQFVTASGIICFCKSPALLTRSIHKPTIIGL